jgi:hypothetical protein
MELTEVCAVDVVRRDGRRESLHFPSRFGAELYLALLPELQAGGDPEAADITEALLRPVGMGVN